MTSRYRVQNLSRESCLSFTAGSREALGTYTNIWDGDFFENMKIPHWMSDWIPNTPLVRPKRKVYYHEWQSDKLKSNGWVNVTAARFYSYATVNISKHFYALCLLKVSLSMCDLLADTRRWRVKTNKIKVSKVKTRFSKKIISMNCFKQAA